MSKVPPSRKYLDGQHPDAGQLSAFVEKKLSPQEYKETLVHLADCADCRQKVAFLPPFVEAPLVEPYESSPSSPLSESPQPKLVRKAVWVAGLTLAALVFLLIFLRTRPRRQAIAPPQSQAAKIDRSARLAPKPKAGKSTAVANPATTATRVPTQRKTSYAASHTPQPSRARSAQLSSSRFQPERNTHAVRNSHEVSPPDSSQTAVGSDGVLIPVQTGRVLQYPSAKGSTDEKVTLPSGLPVLSFAASQLQRIAIDTASQVFSSQDAGETWSPVVAPWRGRAISVAVADASRATATFSNAEPTAFAVPERYTPGGSAVIESDEPSDSLSGRVTNASGAAVPRASVTLIDGRTSIARTVETDSSGRFLLINFVPGLCRIDVQAIGFKGRSLLVDLSSAPQVLENITLEAGQSVAAETSTVIVDTPSKVDGRLQPGTPRAAIQPARSPIFVITTDTGKHWESTDGHIWRLR